MYYKQCLIPLLPSHFMTGVTLIFNKRWPGRAAGDSAAKLEAGANVKSGPEVTASL